jgi:hypothetical protein
MYLNLTKHEAGGCCKTCMLKSCYWDIVIASGLVNEVDYPQWQMCFNLTRKFTVFEAQVDRVAGGNVGSVRSAS